MNSEGIPWLHWFWNVSRPTVRIRKQPEGSRLERNMGWKGEIDMNREKKIAALLPCLLLSQFSHSVVSNFLRPRELEQVSLPCPSPTPRACSNMSSCPLSRWCHATISSSVVPFSSCLQSFPASRSFPMSQLFTSGGQSIGVSASALVLPMNIQDWFPLGLTGLISFHCLLLLSLKVPLLKWYKRYTAQMPPLKFLPV